MQTPPLRSAKSVSPRGSRKRRWVGRIGLGIVILTACVLIAARLVPGNLENTSDWYIAVSYPLFLIRVYESYVIGAACVVALSCLLARCWGLGVIGGLGIAALTLPGAIAPQPALPSQPAAGELRLMTCNVLANNPHHAEALEEIARLNPDILLLNEYGLRWQEAAGPHLRAEYPHHFEIVWPGGTMGIALFSRVPLIDPKPIRASTGGREWISAGVELDGQLVTIMGVHPRHPLGVSGYRENRLHAAQLAAIASSLGGGVIIMGDCNFPTGSAQGDRMRKVGLRDAPDIARTPRAFTWPSEKKIHVFPRTRIDHIYVTDGISVSHAVVGDVPGSDHRPVIADIGVKR